MKVAFKKTADAEPFSSALLIVGDAIDTDVNSRNSCKLPYQKSLFRHINIVWKATRHNHPDNLKFDFNLDAIPDDFVQAGIMVLDKKDILLMKILSCFRF